MVEIVKDGQVLATTTTPLEAYLWVWTHKALTMQEAVKAGYVFRRVDKAAALD